MEEANADDDVVTKQLQCIHFRMATKDDVPALAMLRILFLKEINEVQTNINEVLFIRQLENYFYNHLTRDFVSWLALDGEAIVATGGICFNSFPPSFESMIELRGYIMNMYVLHKYRKQGIGAKIFEKLMQEARNRKVSMVSLHATEMAKELYRRFGFQTKNGEMTKNIF